MDASRTSGDPAEAPGRLRIEITGDLDRKAVEALRLEIQRLSRLHGIPITHLGIERVPAEPREPSG